MLPVIHQTTSVIPSPCFPPSPPWASRILIKGGCQSARFRTEREGEGEHACRSGISSTHSVIPPSYQLATIAPTVLRPRHDANPQRENDQTKRNRTTVSRSLDRQKRQEANSNITRICLFLTVVILITLVFAVDGVLSPRSRSIAVDPQQITKSI